MVRYLDKQVGQFMETLDALGISDNTVLIFLADNGTDRSLTNLWGDRKEIQGGKGTMTDRGSRVPLIVRWPGKILAGSTCDDLIDFSDLFPTLCELAGAKLPTTNLHGRSFMPQLLGIPGSPREWVHVQNKEQRHVRNRECILNNRNQLRPVVEIWKDPAPACMGKPGVWEQSGLKTLQAAFDELGS